MTKLEETIGFLEMLKGLNKTVIEIDSIMHRLTEMQEEAINYTHSCKSDSEQLCANCLCKPTQKLGFCNECFDNIYSNA